MCLSIPDHNDSIHPLIGHFEPLPALADKRALVGGGIEFFRRAAVAFHQPESGVASVGGRTTDGEQLREHMLHLLAGGRFDAQPEIRRIAVGAADTKLFHFEAAVVRNNGIEDLFHHV